MVDNWAGVAGCVVAALTAVYFHDLPNKLWVLVAIVVGVAVESMGRITTMAFDKTGTLTYGEAFGCERCFCFGRLST